MYFDLNEEAVIHHRDLSLRYPLVLLPRIVPLRWLSLNGFAPFLPTPEPLVSPTEEALNVGYVLVDGVYTNKWEVQTKPNDVLWADIRSKRDHLIQDITWRFERNASETRLGLPTTDDIAALDAYVQTLRDIPTVYEGRPLEVVWPEPPSENTEGG